MPPSNPQRQNRASESGNAFFIVMIAVVLFAALMFTFSRGARQGGENMSDQKARIAASELISTAQKYERALNGLLLKGCSENQISFEESSGMLKMQNGTAYTYTNASAPGDETCHFFSRSGGRMAPYVLPEEYTVDASLPCPTCLDVSSPLFTSLRVVGHGNESGARGADLVLWLGRVSKKLCTEINNQLGVSNPSDVPPVESWNCSNGDSAFTGTFAACADPVGDNAVLTGQSSFCVDKDSSGWNYIYMTVLHAR